jgi:DNA-binding NtrC family response regulator
MTKGRVLLVEDDAAWGDLLAKSLTRRGFEASWLKSPDEALSTLSGRSEVDVVLTDLQMPGMTGTELCRRVAAMRPDVPVVVITAFGSLETAIEAIRVGAYDFVTKPVEVDALVLTLERAVQHRRLSDEVKRLRQAVAANAPSPLVGESPAYKRLVNLVGRVTDSEATVLIMGESGTGKEVLARHLHETSRRKDGPFIAVNCAAMPETLLESELFGHVKGAFTDARANRVGLFAQAQGGTLLLDEIGEMPLALQPKLLRALQEKVVRPLGAEKEIPFDARIIAATNRDLETAVEEGRFREDLFFRLNVISFELPPLRLRGNDVLLLAQHFLARAGERAGKKVTGISPGAAAKLLAWTWPGNVRELQNCIERAVAFAQFEQLQEDDLPDKVKQWNRPAASPVGDTTELATLADIERRHIERVLEATNGNRTLAAKMLGIDRKTLWRKLGAAHPTTETPPAE